MAKARRDALQVGLAGELPYAKQLLCLGVVRREIGLDNRPACESAGRLRSEFPGTKAQQCRAIPLRLATEIEILFRDQRATAPVPPDLAALERALVDDLVDV